jgi:hypothetical protein
VPRPTPAAENVFLNESGPRTRMPTAKSRVRVDRSREAALQSHACEISSSSVHVSDQHQNKYKYIHYCILNSAGAKDMLVSIGRSSLSREGRQVGPKDANWPTHSGGNTSIKRAGAGPDSGPARRLSHLGGDRRVAAGEAERGGAVEAVPAEPEHAWALKHVTLVLRRGNYL